MVVSHKYKFIFVRIPNCGNEFISESLLPYLGQEDEVNLTQFTSSKEIKQVINAEIWDNYFKFAFVRSPWEMEISSYQSWGRPDVSFREYILNYSYEVNEKTLSDFLGEDIDYVGRHETLEKDFSYLCGELNLPKINLILPSGEANISDFDNRKALNWFSINQSGTPVMFPEQEKHIPDSVMRSYYSENKVIGKMYSKYYKDIKLFDYEMPGLFDSPEDLNKFVYFCKSNICPGHSQPHHNCVNH